MKNHLFTLFTLLIIGLGFQSKTQAQSYCENGAYSAHYFWIESVASNEFYHSAGYLQGHLDDQDHLYHGYLDYTEFTLNWQEGLNPITLTSGTSIPGYEMYWQVWIDLNADFEFTEDELMLSTSSMDVVDGNINLSGLGLVNELSTRMRVSMSFMAPAPACGPLGYGEVEDYTVTIQAPPKTIWRVPEEYNSIQEAIDVADPDGMVLVNDGIYYEYVVVNKPLTLKSVNGSDVTVITSNEINKNTIVVSSNDVTVDGFEFAGPEGTYSRRSNILVTNSNNAKILNNRCGFMSSDVYDGTGVRVAYSENVLIEGLICEMPSPQGIFISNSIGTQVNHSLIVNQKGKGINIDLSAATEIRDNVIENNGYYGIYSKRSTSGLVSENSCNGGHEDPALSQKIGIYLTDSSEFTVVNNQCNGNLLYGIHLYQAENNALIGNSTEYNLEMGIYSYFSNGLQISNNISAFNQKYGFKIWASEQMQITGNTAHDNGEKGMFLYNLGQSLISRNEVWNNPIEMNLEFLRYSTVRENIIAAGFEDDSECQLTIRGAYDNQMYLNSFLFSSHEICSSEISQYSYLQWYSDEIINYTYQNQEYSSQLGNFYLDGDHLDTDADGVADLQMDLTEHFGNDPFSLAEDVSEFIIQ